MIGTEQSPSSHSLTGHKNDFFNVESRFHFVQRVDVAVDETSGDVLPSWERRTRAFHTLSEKKSSQTLP